MTTNSEFNGPLRPRDVAPRSLERFVTEFGLNAYGDVAGVTATGITSVSSNVQPGDVFVAMPGARFHGMNFAEDAIARGAIAVVTDIAGRELSSVAVPVIEAGNLRASLGLWARWIYQTAEPSMVVAGITGTNGKTSVAYIVEHLWARLGHTTGLSTTAEVHVANERWGAVLTTPESAENHALIARMGEAGVDHAILEVSSHAATYSRVAGIEFDVMGFTNLSRDHLDEYDTMDSYFDAKRALFAPEVSRIAVVCLDTDWGRKLADGLQIPFTTVTTNAEIDADWTIALISASAFGTQFELTATAGASVTGSLPFFGEHMLQNLAVALVMVLSSGTEPGELQSALDRDSAHQLLIPGRLERVSPLGTPAVFVDYGHTPDAIEKILDALRAVTPGRVTLVLGADGDRDSGKRGAMGEAGANGADVLIVTDYNPRFEDPAQIRAALLEGARHADNPGEILEIASPAEAVRFAVSNSTVADSVVWAGPGHEDYREVEGAKVPFPAREIARQIVEDCADGEQ
ncbi:MAG: Mur ligase family protein [Microbacteriaceae bacterium]